MKIQGLPRHITQLQAKRAPIEEAANAANTAKVEKQALFDASQADAGRPEFRLQVPKKGFSFKERVETFDAAFQRIRGARSEDLQQAQQAAWKLQSVQTSL